MNDIKMKHELSKEKRDQVRDLLRDETRPIPDPAVVDALADLAKEGHSDSISCLLQNVLCCWPDPADPREVNRYRYLNDKYNEVLAHLQTKEAANEKAA